MFNFSEWLVNGIKCGFADGTFAFCRVTEITAGYLSRGLISQAEAEEIAISCPAPTENEGESIE